MSKYPPGRFVGYRKFVVDQEWLAMKRFFGEPIQQGKYKVFKVEQVRKSERKKAFVQWLAPRLEKKQLDNPYFTIKKLGQI
ncbi:conserved hypothetical protein [Vibrio nigripulchritudo FTn2]|uniref:hypothetical protein n=1 Tax=Vibrio nigripulchritudo TaxID=28173 RepID=UPI0003B19A3B|nr:hypothetical protein [Vibrio nigripulchritudo]CCN40037.1 conserved hypothetical protein [Vibrio nigripulchritudo FTn2]